MDRPWLIPLIENLCLLTSLLCAVVGLIVILMTERAKVKARQREQQRAIDRQLQANRNLREWRAASNGEIDSDEMNQVNA